MHYQAFYFKKYDQSSKPVHFEYSWVVNLQCNADYSGKSGGKQLEAGGKRNCQLEGSRRTSARNLGINGRFRFDYLLLENKIIKRSNQRWWPITSFPYEAVRLQYLCLLHPIKWRYREHEDSLTGWCIRLWGWWHCNIRRGRLVQLKWGHYSIDQQE